MVKRWWVILLAALIVVPLFFPFVTIYTHMQMEPELAAAFPKGLTGFQVMLRGTDALPMQALPALSVLDMRGWTLWLGLVLSALAAILCFVNRKGAHHAAFVLAIAAFLVFLYEAFQLQNASGSLLFHLLLDATAAPWIPVLGALGLAAGALALTKGEEKLHISDIHWRRLGGILCLLAALCLFLPFACTNVPDGFIADDTPSVAALRRSETGLSAMRAEEPSLSQLGKDGLFANVLSGGLQTLIPLSNDSENVRGAFLVSGGAKTFNAGLFCCVLLLAACCVLTFIPKVDRWFPLALGALGTVMCAMQLTDALTVSDADMYASATRQLCYLGVGHTTLAPVLMMFLSVLGFGTQVLGVRYADSPYFANPVPQERRLRAIALALGVISFALMLAPSASFSYYRPGTANTQCTATISGVESLTGRIPDTMLHPTNTRGKQLYGETAAKEGQLNAEGLESLVRGLVTRFSVTTWIAMALCLAGIVLLMLQKSKKLCITAFLLSFAARVSTWALLSLGMPESVGAAGGGAMLYVSLVTLVFAAFFSNFAHLRELPKKFRLFLMILPFLAAVFLFSYMPLYGWTYAFYNYKFGMPMSQQEFVGFKWFTELFANAGHLNNMIRVMKNTFAMSGLGILTSWMPMLFAILLNEVTNLRFKKLVQVFTTLPNFISWALVFSFAMAMFSMETGIFSKFMLGIGAIDKPVAWLNASDNIWLKMWGWSTWKGLGWGAIMYLAAIAGIDQELYEAARVDGAGRWKQMRYITLPGLLPTFFVLLLLSISNIINNGMDQYLVFQNSMNKNTIEVLDLYVYNITIASTSSSMYSFGTAIGILKTLFSVTMLFLANFASKKLRGESIV